MNSNIDELQNKVELFCLSHSSLFSDENEILLADLLKALFVEENFRKRNQLLQMIGMVRNSSEATTAAYASLLGSIAFAAYERCDYDFAEFLFRSVCDLTDCISDKNNLAYMLRRYKTGDLNSREIIMLLMPGIKEYEPHCLTNMGLLFALVLSSPDDWKIADEMFSLMPDNIHGVDDWWEKLGLNNDVEGYLVHFFLLRHNRITHSRLGTTKYLAWKINRLIDNFPLWLSEQYSFVSFADVFECSNVACFDELLDEYLGTMPNNKESVDLMIDALKHKKSRPIYEKLLNQCQDVLTEDEEKHLRYEFKSRFDNPFSNKLTTPEDLSTCLGNLSSQDDFTLLYEYVLLVSEHVNFSPDDSLWGRLLGEIVKNSNTQYVAWLVNWFQNDDDNKWWPLIPVNRVFAEIIRLSCQYDRPKCIEVLRNCGIPYDAIREECWDEPCVAYDKEDDEHSSPLAFAIEANAKDCYMFLLKWMCEANSSISHEGEYVWSSNELKDIFTEIPVLLKNKGLDWPISLE